MTLAGWLLPERSQTALPFPSSLEPPKLVCVGCPAVQVDPALLCRIAAVANPCPDTLAGRLGFEPRRSAPKALDLPLVYRPVKRSPALQSVLTPIATGLGLRSRK